MAIQQAINSVVGAALDAYRTNAIKNLKQDLTAEKEKFQQYRSKFQKGGRPKGSKNKPKAADAMMGLKEQQEAVVAQREVIKTVRTKKGGN